MYRKGCPWKGTCSNLSTITALPSGSQEIHDNQNDRGPDRDFNAQLTNGNRNSSQSTTFVLFNLKIHVVMRRGDLWADFELDVWMHCTLYSISTQLETKDNTALSLFYKHYTSPLQTH